MAEMTGPFKQYEQGLSDMGNPGKVPETADTASSAELFRILRESDILKMAAKQAMMDMEDGDEFQKKQAAAQLETLRPMFQNLHTQAVDVGLTMGEAEQRYFKKMLAKLDADKKHEHEVNAASKTEMANSAIMNQMMQTWRHPDNVVGPPAPPWDKSNVSMDEMMRNMTTQQPPATPNPFGAGGQN